VKRLVLELPAAWATTAEKLWPGAIVSLVVVFPPERRETGQTGGSIPAPNGAVEAFCRPFLERTDVQPPESNKSGGPDVEGK
jgi:hypothetical protein